MKITIDVDCTPEEARTFLGLPDVGPLNRAYVDEMRKRMGEALGNLDPETMFKAWMPQGAGWEQWRKMWQQAAGKEPK
ncbi:MAG: DUF6489 family protein [Alphaproteobacteria bacterium]